jgi:hypothetical protein
MTFPSENSPPRQHERNAMTDIVNRLRTNRDCLAPCLMDDAADEIMRLERVVLDLITERDEARREVCVWQGLDTGNTPRDTATVRGWNCFGQDNWPSTKDRSEPDAEPQSPEA